LRRGDEGARSAGLTIFETWNDGQARRSALRRLVVRPDPLCGSRGRLSGRPPAPPVWTQSHSPSVVRGGRAHAACPSPAARLTPPGTLSPAGARERATRPAGEPAGTPRFRSGPRFGSDTPGRRDRSPRRRRRRVLPSRRTAPDALPLRAGWGEAGTGGDTCQGLFSFTLPACAMDVVRTGHRFKRGGKGFCGAPPSCTAPRSSSCHIRHGPHPVTSTTVLILSHPPRSSW
jgi:hypothetical protein